MKYYKNFFFKTFTILMIVLFTTSCTTPWVDDFHMDYALKTLAVGGGAAATVGIGYGIYYLVADLPEKAQKKYNEINEQINEAKSIPEISKAIKEARKYNEKSDYFDYDSIASTANDKLKSLSLPYQVENGTLQFNITPLLQECDSLPDIQNLIEIIKNTAGVDSLSLITNEINNYMYNKKIPYKFDPNTQSLAPIDSIPDILEKLKNESINKNDIRILLQWIKENAQVLDNKNNIADCISSTLETIIKARVYKGQNTSSLYSVCSTYEAIFADYLSMDYSSLKNYILSNTEYFSEEKLYNDAISAGDPYLYTETYPNGQFDASLIPMNAELKDFLNAKTSLETAKEFQEKYPESKYSEDIESYISQEEKKIQEEKLKEWQNSDEFRIFRNRFGIENLTKELYIGQNGFPYTAMNTTVEEFLKGFDWRIYKLNITKTFQNNELIIERNIGYEKLEVYIRFEANNAIFTTASFPALHIYDSHDYQDIATVLACLIIPDKEVNNLIMLNEMMY